MLHHCEAYQCVYVTPQPQLGLGLGGENEFLRWRPRAKERPIAAAATVLEAKLGAPL